jgi:hypothetical protein
MFEDTIAFRDTKKFIGEGRSVLQASFVRFVSSFAERVASSAFDGAFEAETETGKYSRITRSPTRDLCECSPNHECMLNSAIHRQFLRSDIV